MQADRQRVSDSASMPDSHPSVSNMDRGGLTGTAEEEGEVLAGQDPPDSSPLLPIQPLEISGEAVREAAG